MSLIKNLYEYTEGNLRTMVFKGYKDNFKINAPVGITLPTKSPLGSTAIEVKKDNFTLQRKSGDLTMSTVNINVGLEIILLPFLTTNYMPVFKNFITAFLTSVPLNYPSLQLAAPNLKITTVNTGSLILDSNKINKCGYSKNMAVVSIGASDATIFLALNTGNNNNKIVMDKGFVNTEVFSKLGLPFVLSTSPLAVGISTNLKPYYTTISTLAAHTREESAGLYLTTKGEIGPRFIGNFNTLNTNPILGKLTDSGISLGSPVDIYGISKVYSLNGNMPLLGVISNNPDIEKYVTIQIPNTVICGGTKPSGYSISLSTTNLSMAGPNGYYIQDVTEPQYWNMTKGTIAGLCHINPYSWDPTKNSFLLGTLVLGTSAKLTKINFMNELQSSTSDTPSEYPELCGKCFGEPLVFESTDSNEYSITLTSKNIPWIGHAIADKGNTPALYSILMRFEFLDLPNTKTIHIKADSTSVNTINLNGLTKTLPYTETINY